MAGYAIIVWKIFRPAITIGSGVLRDRELVAQTAKSAGPQSVVTPGLILLGVALFMLAFFTIHFGGFHYVHSQFLNAFFPVDDGNRDIAGFSTYVEVVRRPSTYSKSSRMSNAFRELQRPSACPLASRVLPDQSPIVTTPA